MYTCGKCGNSHETADQGRACYHALPFADVIVKDDVMSVPDRGANFFLKDQQVFRHDNTSALTYAEDMAKSYPAPEKFWLNVHYKERHFAKAKGARWDEGERRWWCEANAAQACKQWWPKGVKPSMKAVDERKFGDNTARKMIRQFLDEDQKPQPESIPDPPVQFPVDPPRQTVVVDVDPDDEADEFFAKASSGLGVTPKISKPKELVDEGTYELDGKIFEVMWNKDHTNRYAKQLVEKPENKSGWGYEYAPGVITRLDESMLVSAERAKQFAEESTGKVHNIMACCYCATPIEKPESKRRGYGPICADKRGLPYDHSRKD